MCLINLYQRSSSPFSTVLFSVARSPSDHAPSITPVTMRVLPTALLSLLTTFLPSGHAYTHLSEESLRKIPSADSDFDIHNNDGLLAPILKVRIPGTPPIEDVRQHFIHFFKNSLPNWNIELQNSTQETALKKPITFVNIVATRDPPWTRAGDVGRLALVAHYDSKLTPEGFIGAIDSAAPCAMLMHAARSIDEALTRKWQAMQASGTADDLEEEKGVQILLLDGEEAFITWTSTDSLYGAR
jgi:glutaminyl-peptide cyclotransferase